MEGGPSTFRIILAEQKKKLSYYHMYCFKVVFCSLKTTVVYTLFTTDQYRCFSTQVSKQVQMTNKLEINSHEIKSLFSSNEFIVGPELEYNNSLTRAVAHCDEEEH